MFSLTALKDPDSRETRAPLDPESVGRLVGLGIEVRVESGLGAGCGYRDTDYEAVGAKVGSDRGELLQNAQLVLRINPPAVEGVSELFPGQVHISFLDPFQNKPLLEKLAEQKISAISLEMIPRSTLAQKMDVLSSQANLAGYRAVIEAAARFGSIFPMMMTPAGTLSPAKVFVIGIGVAGLQAIATAKRLGARVTAYDVRPEALEQAESVGAKALRINLGETGSTEQGYAKELTPEQLEKQRQEQARVCAQSDVVITTAKVFGRKAPILVKADVIQKMKAGSVVIDLASETGGNVEGIVVGETVVTDNGVILVGERKLECSVPVAATRMVASNLVHLIEHFYQKESQSLRLDLEDSILKHCLLTHDGAVVHEKFRA